MPDDDDFKHSPHDPFVFQQFSEIEKALPLLREGLPECLVRTVRWPKLTLAPLRFVDPELRSHFSDLVYRAEWLSGEPLFLYVLFEHKSSVDYLTPLQVLVGMVSIWQRNIREGAGGAGAPLPFVYPFVLYHGERRWTVSRQFRDLVWLPDQLKTELTPHTPDFAYGLLDLNQMKMEEIRGSAQVRMILALLKAVSEGREDEWFEGIFFPLIPMLRQRDAGGFLKELLRYLARSSGRIDASTFEKMIDRISNQRIRTDVMTVAQELFQRGLQQGIEQGLQRGLEEGLQQGLQQGLQRGVQEGTRQGSLEGQKKAVLSALEARFGTIPSETSQKILAIDTEEGLSEVLRRAVTCRSLAEFVTAGYTGEPR